VNTIKCFAGVDKIH